MAGQKEPATDKKTLMIPHSEPAGGTGSLEAAMTREKNPLKRFFKVLGPGLITGASDDDPSGIGTYAVAGAALGYWVGKVEAHSRHGLLLGPIFSVTGTGLGLTWQHGW